MKMTATALLAALVVAFPAAAHDVEKGPNGGRVVEAGDHHIELVAKDNTVAVFLTDHDEKALATTGYKGVAILAVGGKSQRIVLAPDAKRLTGQAAGVLPERPKGVVQITTPGGKTVQGKFN